MSKEGFSKYSSYGTITEIVGASPNKGQFPINNISSKKEEKKEKALTLKPKK